MIQVLYDLLFPIWFFVWRFSSNFSDIFPIFSKFLRYNSTFWLFKRPQWFKIIVNELKLSTTNASSSGNERSFSTLTNRQILILKSINNFRRLKFCSPYLFTLCTAHFSTQIKVKNQNVSHTACNSNTSRARSVNGRRR